MIIKQNEQFELHASLTPCNDQQSLVLSQYWPKAQHPHHRQILQVLLSEDECAIFSDFLAGNGGAA